MPRDRGPHDTTASGVTPQVKDKPVMYRTIGAVGRMHPGTGQPDIGYARIGRCL